MYPEVHRLSLIKDPERLKEFPAMEDCRSSPIAQDGDCLKHWRKKVHWIMKPGLHIGHEGHDIVLVVRITYVLFPAQIPWNS